MQTSFVFLSSIKRRTKSLGRLHNFNVQNQFFIKTAGHSQLTYWNLFKHIDPNIFYPASPLISTLMYRITERIHLCKRERQNVYNLNCTNEECQEMVILIITSSFSFHRFLVPSRREEPRLLPLAINTPIFFPRASSPRKSNNTHIRALYSRIVAQPSCPATRSTISALSGVPELPRRPSRPITVHHHRPPRIF